MQIKVVIHMISEQEKRKVSPIVKIIPINIETFKSIIKSDFEIIPFPNMENVCLIVAERDKSKNLFPAMFIPENSREIIFGDFIVSKMNQSGFTSLQDKQIIQVVNYINSHRIL